MLQPKKRWITKHTRGGTLRTPRPQLNQTLTAGQMSRTSAARSEAGVDQHRRVALREQVAVRHRIAARAGGIGADAAVQRKGVLQGVELAFGNRCNSAGKAADSICIREIALFWLLR